MIVAGFGFTSRASVDSLADALHLTGCAAQVGALATAEDKMAGLHELARRLGLPALAVTADAMTRVATHTRSDASEAARQTGSVAEAAALAAAGPGARLIVARCISTDRMATCAIAEGDGMT